MFINQSDFSTGEVTPLLAARIDTTEYRKGLETVKNCIIHTQGGFSNRPGTKWLKTFDGYSKFRQIAFSYNVEQTYSLIFVEDGMFVIKDGAFVQTDEEVDYMLDLSGYGVTADILDEIKFCQSADVLYCAHTSFFPFEISRIDHDDWTVEALDFDESPNADRTEDNSLAVVRFDSFIGDGITVNAYNSTPFTSVMENQTLRIGIPDLEDESVINWGVCRITDFSTSATVIVETISDVIGENLLPYGSFNYGIYGEWGLEGSLKSQVTTEDQIISIGNMGEFTYDADNGYLNFLADGNNTYFSDDDDWPLHISSYPISFGDSYNTQVYYRVQVDGGYDSEITSVSAKYGLTIVATSEKVTESNYSSIDDITLGSKNVSGSSGVFVTGSFACDLTEDIYLSVWKYCSCASVTMGYIWMNSYFDYIVLTGQNSKYSVYWRVPEMADDSTYFGVCSLFQQRLVLGASEAKPQSLWHSKTGAYYDFGFTTPLEDDDAFSYTIAAKDFSGINWICTIREMLVGTDSGIWQIWSGSSGGSMTPTAKTAQKKYSIGTSDIDPIVIGQSVLFIERGKTRVHEISNILTDENFTGRELSVTAPHLFEGKVIVDWAYARLPYSMVICILDDGTAAVLTYDNLIGIYAWYTFETSGNFLNVCVTPRDDGDDYVYFIVERVINEATVYFSEVMQKRIVDLDTKQYWFLDAGLSYSGSAQLTFSGADHLAGETVEVVADGGYIGEVEVDASGSITLNNSASTVLVGLSYDSLVTTLPVDIQDDFGTLDSRRKNISSVGFSVYSTAGFGLTVDEGDQEIQFRAQDTGLSPPIYSGFTDPFTVLSDSEQAKQISVSDIGPLPFTVRSITIEIRETELLDAGQ